MGYYARTNWSKGHLSTHTYTLCECVHMLTGACTHLGYDNAGADKPRDRQCRKNDGGRL